MNTTYRSDPFELTHRWHSAFNVPILGHVGIPDDDRVALRKSLMEEEFAEWTAASDDRDIVAIADALADLEVVLNGTALEYGIPLNYIRFEVYRSNMSKLGPEGKPIYREDGKVLKGPDFRLPDIAGVLRSRG